MTNHLALVVLVNHYIYRIYWIARREYFCKILCGRWCIRLCSNNIYQTLYIRIISNPITGNTRLSRKFKKERLAPGLCCMLIRGLQTDRDRSKVMFIYCLINFISRFLLW